MGDRSPKAKERGQKQKQAAKAKEKTKKDAGAETGRAQGSAKK
jgi:hypothetical protein